MKQKYFDIMGDIHGCYWELVQLLTKLGYVLDGASFRPPENRLAVFVGDITSRGPNSLATLFLVKDMIRKGYALAVKGNHCDKIERWAMGRNVILSHGDDKTVREIENSKTITKREIMDFFSSLPYFLVLDGGKLAVTHAAWKDSFLGQDPLSKKHRGHCLFGPTTGEFNQHDLPVRIDWAINRHPSETDPIVVYGHQPYREVRIINKTYGIDTGCVFGGSMTALRYPEMEVVQVMAAREYETLEGRFAPPLVSREGTEKDEPRRKT